MQWNSKKLLSIKIIIWKMMVPWCSAHMTCWDHPSLLCGSVLYCATQPYSSSPRHQITCHTALHSFAQSYTALHSLAQDLWVMEGTDSQNSIISFDKEPPKLYIRTGSSPKSDSQFTIYNKCLPLSSQSHLKSLRLRQHLCMLRQTFDTCVITRRSPVTPTRIGSLRKRVVSCVITKLQD